MGREMREWDDLQIGPERMACHHEKVTVLANKCCKILSDADGVCPKFNADEERSLETSVFPRLEPNSSAPIGYNYRIWLHIRSYSLDSTQIQILSEIGSRLRLSIIPTSTRFKNLKNFPYVRRNPTQQLVTW